VKQALFVIEDADSINDSRAEDGTGLGVRVSATEAKADSTYDLIRPMLASCLFSQHQP
jgi:hypothetical protein